MASARLVSLFLLGGACADSENSRTNGRVLSALSAPVRIVDARGRKTNAGLLQVRVDDDFGTVCGINAGAASVVCRLAGYDYGVVGSSPCSSYGGSAVCGALGSGVAAKDLVCAGGELDLAQCSWNEPTADCQQHLSDTVVYCGAHGSRPREGSLRLLADDGAPSIDGAGRLEMFWDSAWGTVCKDSFAAGNVACKELGYSGFVDAVGCAAVAGKNYCSPSPPRVTEMVCRGSEGHVSACGFKVGEDVFCAPNEGVVLRCAGEGGAGEPAQTFVSSGRRALST